MNCIEKIPQPPCCRACPETSVEICFRCEHFLEKYAVLETELAEELERRRMIRDLLDVERDQDYDVLRWNPVRRRPANFSCVMLKEWDETMGVVCSAATYEENRFWYYSNVQQDTPVEEARILGWSYFPYSAHSIES